LLADFGGARRRLAALVGAVSSGIAGGFIATLGSAGAGFERTQNLRREQLRRVIALDPVIDQAFGESSELRYYSPVLQRGVGGLYAALAAWRTASVLLSRLNREQAREVVNSVLPLAPPELRAESETDWLERPGSLRGAANRAARKLMTMPAETPALQLLADKTAAGFSGLDAQPCSWRTRRGVYRGAAAAAGATYPTGSRPSSMAAEPLLRSRAWRCSGS
jgi:hypothetical protein